MDHSPTTPTPSAGRGSRFRKFYDKNSFYNRPEDYIEKMIESCFGTGGFHKLNWQEQKTEHGGQFDDVEKEAKEENPRIGGTIDQNNSDEVP